MKAQMARALVSLAGLAGAMAVFLAIEVSWISVAVRAWRWWSGRAWSRNGFFAAWRT
jgi:hypothetical protein